MQTQDLGYLMTKKNEETQKIERLKSSLQMISSVPQEELRSRHTVFVDTEQEASNFDPAKYFDTPKEFLGRAFNRPTEELLDKNRLVASRTTKKLTASRLAAYNELATRMKREKELYKAIRKVQLRKNITLHSGVRKRTRNGKTEYSWKKERSS